MHNERRERKGKNERISPGKPVNPNRQQEFYADVAVAQYTVEFIQPVRQVGSTFS